MSSSAAARPTQILQHQQQIEALSIVYVRVCDLEPTGAIVWPHMTQDCPDVQQCCAQSEQRHVTLIDAMQRQHQQRQSEWSLPTCCIEDPVGVSRL